MDKKVLELCKDNNQKALAKYIENLKIIELLEIVTKFIRSGKEEVVILLRGILQGKSHVDFQKNATELYMHAFNILNEEDVPLKMGREIVGFLLLEVDALSVKSWVKLIDFIINAVKSGAVNNGKSLELFPKILTNLASLKTIVLSDGSGEMRGAEYKSHVLNTLCSSRWSAAIVVHLATMLRDVPMTMEELSFVITKIVRMFKEIQLQEIPAVCYQLLLLSAKGHKRMVLDGICSFFNEKDKCAVSTMENSLLEDTSADTRQTKGTVILHIIFAMKQDQDLGREYLKYLKANQQGKEHDNLTAFNVALLLATSSIKRLEEGIFEYLKNTILKIYKEDERRDSSLWFRELFPEGCKIDETISSVLEYSKYGWDDVVQGLVQFGFTLMDCFTPRQNDLFNMKSPRTPAQRACCLGAKILKGIFKDQDFLREEIIGQILNIIATRVMQNATHFIDLLATLAASMPQVMLDCLPKIKEVFDYISLLTPATAEGILNAVLPLMKISLNMKDSLVMVLRKAMFSRQAESRKIAVTGFLLILKHFKIPITDGLAVSHCSQFAATQSYSCSQVQIPSGSRFNSAANESICFEILGNLRRCITQQADVRLHLYEGLFEVVSKNPRLTYSTLELLHTQFVKYYEKNEDMQAPVKLDACLSHSGGQVSLAEPLAHLLNCLQLCTKKSGRRLDKDEEEDEPLSHLLDDVEGMLKSLTRRMLKAELEDFELDKSADFSVTTSVGMKNNIFAKIVTEIYEVLIEYNWMTSDYSEQVATNLTLLFDKRVKVNDLLSEKAGSSAGKKGKPATSRQGTTTFLSLKCLAQFLHAVFCDTDAEHEKGIQALRENIDFPRFLVSAILHKLNQILDTKHCDGPGGQNPEHILKQCCSLGRIFLYQINGDTCLPESVSKKDKTRKLTSSCVDGLHTIVAIICTHFKDELPRFLDSLEFSASYVTQTNANDASNAIHRHLRRFQRMALNILVSPDDEIGMKEVHTIFNIMAHLVQQLDHTKMTQCCTWFQQACVEHNIDDTAVAKALLSLTLSLHRKSKTSTNLVREIAQDIHSQLGDIDEEVEVENRSHYAVINQRTVAPTVFLLVLSHLEKLLDEFDWVLSKLKTEAAGPQPDDEQDKEDISDNEDVREKIEITICHRLIGLVTTFHELIQSAFPEGASADSITKALTKLFTVLAALSKYHLTLYAQKIGHLTLKFEKLVKFTGTHLTQQTYAMITYMQATQHLADESIIAKGKKNRVTSNAAQKNRAIKESKLIPNLIYSIEQYERFLIQLSKKSKITNLMEHFKLSTSRDFRINCATLEAALQESEEEEDADQSTKENDTPEPSKKRSKLALKKT